MPKNTNFHADGYIKFSCIWQKAPALPKQDLIVIKKSRDELRARNYIGAYTNGIGFGNISVKHERGQFIISGSGTGEKEKSTDDDFTLVTSCDINHNEVHCRGPVKASSESLSHAALYICDPIISAVIHIHNRKLWEKLLPAMPATSPDAAYGTPEMASEIKRLYLSSDLPQKKVLVMAGHEEGIMIFGKSLKEAMANTMKLSKSVFTELKD